MPGRAVPQSLKQRVRMSEKHHVLMFSRCARLSKLRTRHFEHTTQRLAHAHFDTAGASEVGAICNLGFLTPSFIATPRLQCSPMMLIDFCGTCMPSA
eukprot:5288526-Pleurochrysis_carterae.AAC.1